MWIPAYNWVYCAGQHQLGEGLAGMAVGSVMASVMCYPLFMVKTNLLLAQQQARQLAKGQLAEGHGAREPPALSLPRQVAAAVRATLGVDVGITGLVSALRYTFRGVVPHMISSLGPDCLCMGMARMAYATMYPEDGAFEV